LRFIASLFFRVASASAVALSRAGSPRVLARLLAPQLPSLGAASRPQLLQLLRSHRSRCHFCGRAAASPLAACLSPFILGGSVRPGPRHGQVKGARPAPRLAARLVQPGKGTQGVPRNRSGREWEQFRGTAPGRRPGATFGESGARHRVWRNSGTASAKSYHGMWSLSRPSPHTVVRQSHTATRGRC
jgi:hypothetical protein